MFVFDGLWGGVGRGAIDLGPGCGQAAGWSRAVRRCAGGVPVHRLGGVVLPSHASGGIAVINDIKRVNGGLTGLYRDMSCLRIDAELPLKLLELAWSTGAGYQMQVQNPLVESRATTTIKLIDVGKYLAEKKIGRAHV